jgi:vacuolar iron transporter family protein
VEKNPKGEIEEIRQIYISKGFSGNLLDEAVNLTISDRSRWISTMLSEEYGFNTRTHDPLKSALATFIAFAVAGVIPLISFIFSFKEPYLISMILTGASFFLIGSLKSLWTIEHFAVAGLKTLAVGTVAAAVAFFVGQFLKSFG